MPPVKAGRSSSFYWTWWWSENSELQGTVVPVDYDFKKNKKKRNKKNKTSNQTNKNPESFTEWYRFTVKIKDQKVWKNLVDTNITQGYLPLTL